MTSIVVGTQDLRAALTALRGHVPTGKDAQHAWIRAEVTGPNLQLTATNLYQSSAIALVSVIENEDGEAGIFDLHPSEIAELLLAFKAGTGDAADEVGPTVRIVATGAALQITDISGFWPGKQLSFPRIGPYIEDFPNVANLFGNALARRPLAPARIITNGPALAAFAKAATAYSRPLVIELASDSGRLLLVTCGDSFLGLLLTAELDEDLEAQVKQWRADWQNRLAVGDPQ